MLNPSKYNGISICINNDSKFLIPRIYTNNTWKLLKCYLYDGATWQLIGGAETQMLWFYDADGKVVYAGDVPFLVREKK